MKRALYLALFLAITAGLAGGLLSVVNDLTYDKIAEAALSKELIYLEEIFPGANFKKVEDANFDNDMLIDKFEAEGKGVVYKVVSNGYGGEITFLVGFNTDQTIAGLAVISHSETPGFGDVIETDGYRNLNVGKTASEALDTQSGATISSKAVNTGIIAAATDLAGGDLVVEEADVEFGEKIMLNSDKLDRYKAEILNKEVDGENTVYEVQAEGYGVKDAEYPKPEYKENVFEITVNTETKAIVSIKLTVFGDTEGLGDAIDNSKYFETFIGKSSVEDEADTVSGATKSAYSLLSAIKAVLED